MDEAEVLADRLAIVSKGQLQACGTSMFLKKKYGQGFYIEIDPLDQNEKENYTLSNAIKDSLAEIGYNDSIKVTYDDAGKIIYELPYQLAEQFTTLFSGIDDNMEQYGIKDYVVRSSTLEEVFITLKDMED